MFPIVSLYDAHIICIIFQSSTSVEMLQMSIMAKGGKPQMQQKVK